MDEFDRHNQRKDKFYEKALASPVVELTGIVSPFGVGAGKSPGQQVSSMFLTLAAWRSHGGPIRTESLTIYRRVTDDELLEFWSVIAADTVVRIRARVAEDNDVGFAQAYLEEYLGLADDRELQARLDELKKPKTVEDVPFGTFTFDRRAGYYSAEVKWVGETIELRLNAEEPDEIKSCLKIARDLWSQQSSWKTRIDDFAAQALLALKNDRWLEDDETELSPEDFKSKMTLQSISIYPDGNFDFWYDDGDLFWGHSIQVSGSLADGPTSAGIPG
jgi:hypothetical protein